MMTRPTAAESHRAALLMVFVLAAALGCQRGESSNAVRSDSGSLAQERAEHVPEGLGEACRTPEDCNSYLWCMDESCQVPPAVKGEADASTPTVSFVDAKGREVADFYVELATTIPEQRKGLMFRREMDDEWGMLFVYGEERRLSFWMENTFIALDMVFIDGEGRIVRIVEEAEPLTRTKRRSKRPARYVLELNAGTAEQAGLETGMTMRLDNVDEVHQPDD